MRTLIYLAGALVLVIVAVSVYWGWIEPQGQKGFSYEPSTDVMTVLVWAESKKKWMTYRTVRQACKPGVRHLWNWDIPPLCRQIFLDQKEPLFLPRDDLLK
jgi:hypothetical protein